ncbi:hypothetical protein PQO03_14900 [Lentisphaera profundi]|uniref:Sulfotransferase domain-containing protein n=1 Tax=Lentisphaera profundi TaxID=1658616 RepID=A0ABY7VYF2_9BACT|nr:hypothetical protein [Lentisphaera profundi]WDE99122.1 hypothetical protein PQO03_14900 [Lentisphaera profundi]
MKKFETLYLHIGTRKTGTTVIQNYCRDNKELLMENGILYPTSDLVMKHDASNHHLLFRSKTDDFSEIRQEILANKNTAKVCLISSELLEDINRDPRRTKELCGLAKKVKVIVYLRRQESYLESSFCQKIKLQDFKSTIDEHGGDICLDYSILLEFWSEMVGKENVIVRPYEKGQFVNGNIFDDFLNIFGLKNSEGFKVLKSFTNPSLDLGALEFKRVLNYLGLTKSISFKTAKVLEKRALNLGKNKAFSDHGILTTKEKLNYIKKYEESNNSIAKEFLKTEILFKVELPKISDADIEQKIDFLCDKTIKDIVDYLIKENPELVSNLIIYLQVYLKYFAEDSYVIEKMQLILDALIVGSVDPKAIFIKEFFRRRKVYSRMKKKLI